MMMNYVILMPIFPSFIIEEQARFLKDFEVYDIFDIKTKLFYEEHHAAIVYRYEQNWVRALTHQYRLTVAVSNIQGICS